MTNALIPAKKVAQARALFETACNSEYNPFVTISASSSRTASVCATIKPAQATLIYESTRYVRGGEGWLGGQWCGTPEFPYRVVRRIPE